MQWEGVAALVAIVALGFSILNLWLYFRSTYTKVSVALVSVTETDVRLSVRNHGLGPVSVAALHYELDGNDNDWTATTGLTPPAPVTVNGRGRRELTVKAEGADHGHVVKLPSFLRRGERCTFIVKLTDGQEFRSPRYRYTTTEEIRED